LDECFNLLIAGAGKEKEGDFSFVPAPDKILSKKGPRALDLTGDFVDVECLIRDCHRFEKPSSTYSNTVACRTISTLRISDDQVIRF
jgi:hypothetical protein